MFSTVLKKIDSKLGRESGDVDDIKNDLNVLWQRNETLSRELSGTNQRMAQLEETVSKHKETHFAKQNEFEKPSTSSGISIWKKKTAPASFVPKCQIGISKRLQHP